MIYCIVPWELAERLHEPLRRFYAGDPSVEVVIERRNGERRRGKDRRARAGKGVARKAAARKVERRLIHSAAGRRAGERRASVVEAEARPLPRKARRHAERLRFVERVEPPTQEAEDLDTARLIVRLQAGERALFDGLYLRYFDRVFTYLRLVLEDYHEAEDAAQEVFVKALGALPRYELRKTTPFRGWLFSIARNYALSRLRALGRVEVEDPETIDRRREQAGAEAEPPRIPDWLTDPDLVSLIEHMPLPQRQVLTLHYMMGLPIKETAAVLGRTPNSVSKLHQRSLEFLHDRLVSLGRESSSDGPRMRLDSQAPLRQARVVRRRRYALTHHAN